MKTKFIGCNTSSFKTKNCFFFNFYNKELYHLLTPPTLAKNKLTKFYTNLSKNHSCKIFKSTYRYNNVTNYCKIALLDNRNLVNTLHLSNSKCPCKCKNLKSFRFLSKCICQFTKSQQVKHMFRALINNKLLLSIRKLRIFK